MNRTIMVTAAVFGVLAVVFGAFGAHSLKELIGDNALETFETGVTYQMYHALLLLLLGTMTQIPQKSKKWIFYFIVAGIFLFSFSIYFLATNSLTSFDFRTIGFITPIGGLFLITGWLLLAYRIIKIQG
jgi:uncharacterized membrane protein YgdD (TMEM256/DUF423 family)